MPNAHIEGAPTWAKCPRCRTDLIETPTHSCSTTGVRTHLYLCTGCVEGVWLRWAKDRPNQWLAVSRDLPSSKLVRQAFIGIGWKPPRGARKTWVPPD